MKTLNGVTYIMINRDSLICRIKELGFPEGEYWVVAGGAMVLYGFKEETRDIDLGCSSRLADELENNGYRVSRCDDGTRKIIYSEDIEVFENWIEGAIEIIYDIPTVSIDGLIMMKKKLGRKKDFDDIELIEKMRRTGCVHL